MLVSTVRRDLVNLILRMESVTRVSQSDTLLYGNWDDVPNNDTSLSSGFLGGFCLAVVEINVRKR